MKKDTSNKLDIYKLKTSEELLKYYQDWTDNNQYNKDMVDWNYTRSKGNGINFEKICI